MSWLIRQLFGAHALAQLGDKARAAIAVFIAANPVASETSVKAWATQQADLWIARVLAFFPGWAVQTLETMLNGEIARLVDAAYASVAIVSEGVTAHAG